MPDETQPDPYCAVCERRLLPGERPIDFVTRDGATVLVCELCKPRAEAAGWLRPDEYEAMRGSAPTRDRRRPRGAERWAGCCRGSVRPSRARRRKRAPHRLNLHRHEK